MKDNTVYQRLRVPVLERLALRTLAEQWGVTEEDAFATIVRDAVMREVGYADEEAWSIRAYLNLIAKRALHEVHNDES